MGIFNSCYLQTVHTPSTCCVYHGWNNMNQVWTTWTELKNTAKCSTAIVPVQVIWMLWIHHNCSGLILEWVPFLEHGSGNIQFISHTSIIFFKHYVPSDAWLDGHLHQLVRCQYHKRYSEQRRAFLTCWHATCTLGLPFSGSFGFCGQRFLTSFSHSAIQFPNIYNISSWAGSCMESHNPWTINWFFWTLGQKKLIPGIYWTFGKYATTFNAIMCR